MKKLVFDIDCTLATPKREDEAYSDLRVRQGVVELLRAYHERGFQIALFSSRGMRTYSNSVGHLNARVLPALIAWLDKHDIPYDEVHLGKPWCGDEGFYVDDRAIRPSEFMALSFQEITNLLDQERSLASEDE